MALPGERLTPALTSLAGKLGTRIASRFRRAGLTADLPELGGEAARFRIDSGYPRIDSGRSRISSACVRVRDFGNAHRRQFPDGSMGGKAFRAVEAAIAEIDAHNKTLARNGGGEKQARAAARAALVEALTEIASTARLMSKSSPGADDVFHVSEKASDVSLLATARSILHESRLAVNRLVLCGLPKTFVTDLQALIERFEQAIDGRRSKRSDVATAQQGLKTAFSRALDACRTLDIVVTITLKKDPVKVATWRRDRRVNPRSRVVVPVLQPAATPPEATPPEPPATAPARRPVLVPASPRSEEPAEVVPFDGTDRKAS